MYVLIMLIALGLSVLVFGIVAIANAARNQEESNRKDHERYNQWENIVDNLEYPTQSQIWLKKVAEDNERTKLTASSLFEVKAKEVSDDTESLSDELPLVELAPKAEAVA